MRDPIPPRSAAVALAVALATNLGGAQADEAPARLEVFPPEIRLSNARDRQRMVVVATADDGITRDVTAESTLTPANPALLRREGAVFRPIADGSTTLAASFGGRSVEVPVEVSGAAEVPPLSFRLDVMPVFLRAGCNTGSCHGSARGKDGFRLSLFGFDPEGDYHRLTRELPGRRVNLAVPADSTLLQKAINAVNHTGGKRLEADGEAYRTVLDWIAAGAPNDDAEKLPTVVGVDLFPKALVLEGEGSTQQLTVRARYSDGTDRDVTDLAVFLSNNDPSAAVGSDGLVTAGKRGEAFVMARFETHTVGTQAIVLPEGIDFDDPAEPAGNAIDALVASKLRKLRIAPSELCTDEVFLRRITLDLVGLLPTPEERLRFLASSDPEKRTKRVDELLGRREFAEIWVSKWAEMLQVRTVNNRITQKGMFLYYNWLVDQLAAETPMDRMVRDLLTASGGTFAKPATNFYQGTPDRLLLAENVAQVFLGMRIQCAQCHNHPFDRWTQDDYYGFAAFFAQIGRKAGEDYREAIISNGGGGETKHPVGGRVMKPKFLGGDLPEVAGKDRRAVLADWLTSAENPWFARSFANRVWAHFFGVGIVEPVDDVRVSNPPSNPELLDELGRRFAASSFDLKALVREICNSKTYQRSTRRNPSNADDERNFAHANLRRLKAENLLDCISQVTETRDKFAGLPPGARAVQIANGATSTYFLTTFGRATRETVCSCEVKMEPTLSQALHLLNGNTVNAKIQEGGVVKQILQAESTAEGRIAALYLRCFSRMPETDELARLSPLLADDQDPERGLTDIFWALLNSREFLFNF